MVIVMGGLETWRDLYYAQIPPTKNPPKQLGVCTLHRKSLAPCWGTPNVPSLPPLLREAPYGKHDGNGPRSENAFESDFMQRKKLFNHWYLSPLMWPCDAINILSNNCHSEDVQLMLSEGQQPCWRLEPTPWKPQQDLVGTKLHLVMANPQTEPPEMV